MYYTLLHSNGVGYLNLSDDGAIARLMAHLFILNLEPLKVVWGNEVNLAYEDKWAGSTDLVGLYKDKPTIIDFKQSNKLKEKNGFKIITSKCWLKILALAHKKQYGPIEQGLIAICTKDKVFQGFEMDADNAERV